MGSGFGSGAFCLLPLSGTWFGGGHGGAGLTAGADDLSSLFQP